MGERRRYVVAPTCFCGMPDIGVDASGILCCKSCGNRFLCYSAAYAVSGPQFRTIESWSTAWSRRIADGLRREPESDPAEELRRELSAARGSVAELTARREEDTEHISDLTRRLEEAQAALKVAEKDNARLRGELEDVESSYRHVKSELERSSMIDTRELARLFLDHLTWTYNTVLDGDVPERFRDKVLARTEYAVVKAADVGLNVTHHERRSPLGSARVEIDEIATNDPSLARTVAKSNLFGCSFSNGLAQIPESVTVNRFVDTRLIVVDAPGGESPAPLPVPSEGGPPPSGRPPSRRR